MIGIISHTLVTYALQRLVSLPIAVHLSSPSRFFFFFLGLGEYGGLGLRCMYRRGWFMFQQLAIMVQVMGLSLAHTFGTYQKEGFCPAGIW